MEYATSGSTFMGIKVDLWKFIVRLVAMEKLSV
jgi:hypothetical protein